MTVLGRYLASSREHLASGTVELPPDGPAVGTVRAHISRALATLREHVVPELVYL